MKYNYEPDTFRHWEGKRPIDIIYSMDLMSDERVAYEGRHTVSFQYKNIYVNHGYNGRGDFVHSICPDICKAIDAEGEDGWKKYEYACSLFKKFYAANVGRGNTFDKKHEYVLVNDTVYTIEAYRNFDRSMPYEYFGLEILLDNGQKIKEEHGSKPQFGFERNRPPEQKKYKECLDSIRRKIVNIYKEDNNLPSKDVLDKKLTEEYIEVKKWLDDLKITSITSEQFGDY